MQVSCPLTQNYVSIKIVLKVLSAITLGTFFIAMLIAPYIIKILKKLNILQPGKDELERIIKKARLMRGRPIMGGLIIMITMLIYTIIMYIFKTNSSKETWVPIILILGTILGLISDLSDLRGKLQRLRIHDRYNPLIHSNFKRWIFWHYISTPIRIVRKITSYFGSYSGQGLSTTNRLTWEFILITLGLLLINNITPINLIWLGTFGFLQIPLWLAVIIYDFIGVAFINALNITDGLDGISASNHIISFAGILLLAISLKYYTFARFIAGLIGAELAFFFYNIPNAKVEMSDTGTIPIGAFFFLSLVYLNRVLLSPIFGIWYVIILSSSILQVAWVLLFKKRLFAIAPFHHLLEKYGIERPSIVMYSNIISFVGILIGLILI